MKKTLAILLATLLLLTGIPFSVSAACGIEGHRVTEPTCTEDGYCRDCGIVYARLGHQYNESGICEYCGEKMEVEPDLPDAPVEPEEPEEPVVPEEPEEPVVPEECAHDYEDGYCIYCGEQQEDCAHEWVDGVVTEPNCSNEGVWERYCTLCYRREVEFYPPNGQHVYDYDCDEECNYCGEMRQAPAEHTYSNSCDGDCDVCGYWRGYQEHQYSNGCDTDCNLCGHTRWVSGHWYDHQCDTVCNECGFVREPEGDHEYDLNCDKICNICGHERVGYDHVYSDTYDENCNICGAWRDVPQGNIIYNQPDDVVSENEHYTTFYIEYTGGYYCYWYLVRSGGSAKEVAQGWRLDIDVTRDLNGAYVYCLLKDGPNGDTVARSRNATIHLHVFDNGCDDSCNQCNYLREKRDHSYDSNCDVDCNECGFLREASHDYWGDCDNECHTCGLIREAPHMYYDVCQEECSWCDHRRENAAPHTYDYSCSEYCNVCGEWRDAGNLHVYDNVCDGSCNVCGYWRDVEGHWYDNDCDAECNRCGEIRQARYHWYDNDCDPDCNTCGALRDVAGHRYDDEDDRYCNICGAYRDDEPDIPDISCLHEHAIAATCVSVGYCKDCGQRTEPLGHEYDDDADTECNVCYCTRDLENPCEHECSEPWCYGGNVNGLHVVVYDCMLCYQTVFMDVELCYGGTATCYDPAQCERCYLSYGDADGDHQYDDENDQECNLCGEWREVEPDVPDVPCDHAGWVAPTCTEGGYCRDCGLMFAPLGHSYSENGVCQNCGEKEEVDPDLPADCQHQWTDATCTAPKTCSACGATEGDALGHDMHSDVTIPATCADTGVLTHWCPNCDYQRSEIIPKLDSHAYDAGVVTKAATCTVTGVKTYTCTVCGDTKTETIAKKSHSYKAATCTAPKTCSTCGATEGDALGHDMHSDVTIPATCAETGVLTHWCPNCDYQRSEIIPRSDSHAYDAGVVTKAATCTVTGTKTYTCTVCGDTKTETIAKKSHSYKAATCTAPKTCSVCGATSGKALGHKSDSGKVTKAATCTATGVKTYKCTVCDEVLKTEKIAKKSHSYKAATCTAPKTCKNCGATSGKKLGHKYTNACDTSCNTCKATRKITHDYETVTKKATLTANGYTVKRCAVCDKETGKTTIYKASKISLSVTGYTYNGKVKKPSVTVKDAKGKTIAASNYTVTYATGRKNVGTYKVTVKMKGKYSGTKTLTFTINPAGTSVSKLTAGSKKLTVKWTKKTAQVTGYQIQYSTSKSFKSYKTKTVSKNTTVSTSLTGLKAKTTYYVRVRTYKVVNGKKYYSGWSTVKYKKTK